jgi:anti-sigma factor RsiW
MTSTPALPPTDDDLNAYADGQLAADRAAEVAAALARDPALFARVADVRAQNAALRDALDPMLAEPIPERLLEATSAPPAAARAGLPRWLRPAFAAAATLVLGIALGWFGRETTLERAGTPTTFARAAAVTHALYSVDSRRPVEVWANEEKGLVTWLTRRLGAQAHAPDLNAVGYALVGGRLVAGNDKPTALLMYENADKERLTLQWRKTGAGVGTGEAAFRYAVEDGVGVFYWVDEECAYALAGKLDRSQLLAVARVVYGQITAAEASGKH